MVAKAERRQMNREAYAAQRRSTRELTATQKVAQREANRIAHAEKQVKKTELTVVEKLAERQEVYDWAMTEFERNKGPARINPETETTYSKELALTILNDLACGMTLRQVCKERSLNQSVVYSWVLDNKDGFGGAYARARELQSESWADYIVEVADEAIPTEGMYDDEGAANRIRHANLKIAARQWLMGKNHVKRFGQHPETAGEVDAARALAPVENDLVGEEAKRAIEEFAATRPGGANEFRMVPVRPKG